METLEAKINIELDEYQDELKTVYYFLRKNYDLLFSGSGIYESTFEAKVINEFASTYHISLNEYVGAMNVLYKLTKRENSLLQIEAKKPFYY